MKKNPHFQVKEMDLEKGRLLGNHQDIMMKKNKIRSPHLRHPRALSSKEGYCQRKVGTVGGEIEKKTCFQVEK